MVLEISNKSFNGYKYSIKLDHYVTVTWSGESQRGSVCVSLNGQGCSLQWSQIDLTRRCAWIHPDQAKASRAISVPLSKTAVVILHEQLGKHEAFVFTYSGKPITQVNTKAWRQALI